MADQKTPPDYYSILGVDPSASDQDIKSAYRKQINQYHPDRAPEGLKDEYTEKMKQFNVAFEELGSGGRKPEIRQKYDDFRNRAQTPQPTTPRPQHPPRPNTPPTPRGQSYTPPSGAPGQSQQRNTGGTPPPPHQQQRQQPPGPQGQANQGNTPPPNQGGGTPPPRGTQPPPQSPPPGMPPMPNIPLGRFGRVGAFISSKIGQLGSAVAKLLSKNGLVALGTKALGALIAGPVGIAIAIGSMALNKKTQDAAIGAALSIGNLMSSLFATAGVVVGATVSSVISVGAITLVSIPLLVAFFLFVINSGGYIVPGGAFLAPGTLGAGPGIPVGASCPIPNGKILWGSYGSTYGKGHGTNAYWDALGENCTAYTMNGCYARKAGDYCFGKGLATCDAYGLAADIIYPDVQRRGQQIYLPYLDGEQVTWTYVSGSSSDCNCNGTVRATHDGQVYEMFLSHLSAPPKGGQSGDVTGTLRGGAEDGTPHVHVELSINGQYAQPELMCLGGNLNQSTNTGPGGSANELCETNGGECLNTPNCSRLGRISVPGRCGAQTGICCSKNSPAAGSCEAGGGQCKDTVALSSALGIPVTNCSQLGQQASTGTCSQGSICCK
jgi:hypothetical protein